MKMKNILTGSILLMILIVNGFIVSDLAMAQDFGGEDEGGDTMYSCTSDSDNWECYCEEEGGSVLSGPCVEVVCDEDVNGDESCDMSCVWDKWHNECTGESGASTEDCEEARDNY